MWRGAAGKMKGELRGIYVILALRKLRIENLCEAKTSLGYSARSCLRQNKTKQRQKTTQTKQNKKIKNTISNF